ncbi:MAG: diacylglycerol kinase [Cyanobacteria bacterium P01_C01_bin.89]
MNNSPNAAPSLFPKPKKASKKGTPSQKNRADSLKIAPNLLSSCQYAAAGIQYAFQTQRNFRIQVLLGTLGFSMLAWVEASVVEFCLVLLLVALVMSLELVNTALEAVVDLTVGKTYHELAKIAKDCAAGAVFLSAIAGLIMGCTLVLPQVWLKLSAMI